MAPGANIYSTICYNASSDGVIVNHGYGFDSGTSMAGPIVAGIASLVWQVNPTLSGSQVKKILIDTADIPVDGNGDENCPNMVNAEAAVEAAILQRNDIDNFSKLSAHVIDSETNDAISNATIQFATKEDENVTTTSQKFTTDVKGTTCRFFKKDIQYTHAIISAEGYVTKTIALSNDNFVKHGNLLHYSLGDIALEKVAEEVPHTVSGTVVDANGALAGVGVSLIDSANNTVATGTSSDTGVFTLTVPATGTYTLLLTKTGYGSITKTNLSITEETTSLGSFTMTVSSYPRLQYYNGHTYALIDEQMSWTDAKTFCEKLGGHLVTITSKEENDFLMSSDFYTKEDGSRYYPLGAWIGFSDAAEEGNWQWVTGEAVTYTNWVEPCPEDASGNKRHAVLFPIDTKIRNSSMTTYKTGWHNIYAGDILTIDYLWNPVYKEFICEIDSIVNESVFMIASGECGDNLTWKLDAYGTLTISGTGDMWDYDYNSSPWYSYISSIKKIIVEEGVTRIGSHAFYRVSLYRASSDQSPISLPSTLLSIGSYAFQNAAYSAPLYLPENLKIIEYCAFDHSDFTEIYIPASVEKIGYIEYETNIDDETRNVFGSCHELTQIVVDEANPYFSSENGVLFTKNKDTLITYPEGKTDDTYVMPNSVSSIIDYAFGEFNSNVCLKELTISASLETLSDLIHYKNFECFNVDIDSPYFCAVDGVIYSKDKTHLELYPNCNTAYSYDILDGTEVIASYAFRYCDYLLTINIPESVTTIEDHAIYGCPCINNLVIPSQVTHFYIDFDCDNLTKIYFMGNAPTIDFLSTRESPTLYCIEGKEGWTVPTWTYIPTTYNTVYFDPDTVNLSTIATGTCGDNITWKIDKDGVISFRGTGAMEDYRTYISSKYGYAPWDKFRKTLRKVIIGEGITTIGEYAFDQCGFIEKVSIPSSVTNIKEYAFSDCASLKSIYIPDGVVEIGSRVFYGCDSLTEIHIASSVNCLKYMAFHPINECAHLYFYGDVPGQWANCVLNYSPDYTLHYIEGKSGWTTPTWVSPDGFTYTTATFDPDSVTIEPNDPLPPAEIIASGVCGANGDNVTWTLDDSYALTVTGTGEMADYSYTSDNLAPWSRYRDQITSITIGEGITDTGEFTFYCCKNVPGEITIPDGVTTLGKCSFEGLEKVTSYNIPSTVQQIDGFVFKNNTNLQTLTIPDGVTSIGEETFLGCKNLTHVTIPESVTSIGYSAFYDCYSLSSITLPDSLTSVGNTAFWNAGITGTLYIPKNVTSIGYNAFYCNYNLEAFDVDPANTLLISQDGVLYTHDQTELIQYPRGKTDESYTVPDGVTVIGRLGMAQNGNLRTVILPETLAEIADYAFWASGLTSIKLPASLTVLGARSFEYCGNLTDIYFYGDVPLTCGENIATNGNSALTLHYIEGKSGWTTPTWTSPDGKVYNTAIWNP